MATASRTTPQFEGESVADLPDNDEATLRATVVMGQIALGSSLGIPMPELLEIAGLTPTQMIDPDARVTYGRALALLQRVQSEMGERPVSLALLAMLPDSVFGLIDLASQSVATIGDAFDVHLRYGRLTSSHAQTWIERKGELTAFRLRHLAALEEARHPVEIGVGLAHRISLRRGVEPSEIVEIHLQRAPVGDPALYREAWGCPVFFESFGNATVLRSEVLERPVRHADPVLARSLMARLSSKISEGEDPLSLFRSEVASHAQPAHYNAAAVAKRMGRSLRSLQREATKVGTTLSQVIDDLRVARARELLLDGSLSVDEVGFLVDYSERAAFSRAFKRATGQTPVDWRRAAAS